VLSLVLLGVLAAGYARDDQAPQPALRVSVTFPENAQMHLSLPRPSLAVSPDGRQIVYTAGGGPESPQLWIRDLEDFAPRPIPGTRDGRMATFSPDGRWVAFFTNNQLKKIPLAGGAAVVLCDVAAPYGVTWTSHRTLAGAGRGR